ncbi:MAG: hypothetical protein WEC00_09830 [Dongiaceae bacterium]
MSMKGAGQFLRREIREIIPPTIFFLIAFGLLLLTQWLVLREHGIEVWDLGRAVIGALLVAKILLIVDHFKFIDRYPEKPLIWNVLWKTFVYNVAALLFRYLEALVPLLFKGEGLGAAHRTMIAQFDWAHFAMLHMWLAVLLFAYCTARELIRHIGSAKVARLFFHAREA